MTRINRAIELLEQGQPVYYTGVHELSYESGKEAAQTWADYLLLEMEHGLFDLVGLAEFMRGALENVEDTLKVPGIAFAEWGPGDMGMSFGHKDQHDPPYSPEMADARARVKAACDANHVAFLNSTNIENITTMIDEGVRVTSGGRDAAEIGRKYTKRTMPW